ncbi:L-2-hydroxyglutarate oxidase [Methylocella sp.]|jgi:L-2-hydroxyglutarate oxidase|uniref:L-2-hydroxyglutarate oxidase n=1 Tax=Methylocella sp. TaxID=1978226 RepID=UPI003C234D18
MIHDYGVIGGGIVGLAAAREVARARPGASMFLLEKEAAIARHQTGHNSGVIHSGIYYAPGSSKASLCREGASATKVFCAKHGIPFEDCGKLLVATSEAELVRMDALYKRSRENDIEVERIDARELTRREPNIAGLAALFVPSTAIVDYKRVSEALADDFRAAGGDLALSAEVVAIREEAAAVCVSTPSQTYRARALIVCGGLQSDRLAQMAGVPVSHRIVPFRGEYYALAPSRSGLIRSLIYPIPDPALPFLGVHLTRTMDGSVIVGPNAVLGLAREKYEKFSFDVRDVASFAGFPGFWRAIGPHLRSGLSELRNSLWKRGYLEECRKYCPSLELRDLEPAVAGIRAQAVLRDGGFAHDFVFAETARTLHVCNAPSPAATSAIPIAGVIASKIFALKQRQ